MTVPDTFHIEDVTSYSNTSVSAGLRRPTLTGQDWVTWEDWAAQSSYPGKLSPAGGDIEPLYSRCNDRTRGTSWEQLLLYFTGF